MAIASLFLSLLTYIFSGKTMTLSISRIKTTSRIVDLTDSLPDIAANLIHDSEHFQLPSDIFEEVLFEALNDLVDDFARNTDKYLQPHHQAQIDRIAAEYLNS